MPGFGKVRRYKLIQLQPVAGSENQAIEITNLLIKILNIAPIREIESVPFRRSVERCELCLTRSALLDAMIARALVPPPVASQRRRCRTTRRALQLASRRPRKAPRDSQFVALCHRVLLFCGLFWGLQPFATLQ